MRGQVGLIIMKLLLITSVAQFGKDVKQILKKAKVKTYSYKEVVGHRNASQVSVTTNWFGTKKNENESILFYCFVEKANVDLVCGELTNFNKNQESLSQIHFAVLNIEKSN
jgi:hypothetical protein